MPLLTFNLASRTFDDITKLVERGLYSGLDQFLEVAALNQLALERGVSPDELKAKGHRSPPSVAASTKAPGAFRSSLAESARGGNSHSAASARGVPVARRKPSSST